MAKSVSASLSSREEQLYALLSSRPLSSADLIKQYYGPKPPANARTIVVGRLRGIAEKLDRARDPVRLRKSPRKGPHPIEFWVEKRK